MQELLVGPDPAVMEGVDHRFRLRIPSGYLPPDFPEQAPQVGPIARAPFVARASDFAPAGTARADDPGIISGAISWMAPDYVRSAVDGSRLSSFSQYEVPDGTRYGLEARATTMDHILPSKLYVASSPGGSVMIECAYAPVKDRPQFCQLWSERPDLPLLELFFRQEELPHWQRLRDGAEGLMKKWLAPAGSKEGSNAG